MKVKLFMIISNTSFNMTRNTNRFNVKPVLGFIAGMVVLFCLLGAVMALLGIGTRQFASRNSMIYSILGFTLIWMAGVETFLSSFAFFAFTVTSSGGFTFFTLVSSSMSSFAFIALGVMSFNHFAIFAFTILLLVKFLASFTLSVKSIFFTAVFTKLRERFDLFAMKALFCYDRLRHGFLLTRKLCLEPVAVHSVIGLSYYSVSLGGCQIL